MHIGAKALRKCSLPALELNHQALSCWRAGPGGEVTLSSLLYYETLLEAREAMAKGQDFSGLCCSIALACDILGTLYLQRNRHRHPLKESLISKRCPSKIAQQMILQHMFP